MRRSQTIWKRATPPPTAVALCRRKAGGFPTCVPAGRDACCRARFLAVSRSGAPPAAQLMRRPPWLRFIPAVRGAAKPGKVRQVRYNRETLCRSSQSRKPRGRSPGKPEASAYREAALSPPREQRVRRVCQSVAERCGAQVFERASAQLPAKTAGSRPIRARSIMPEAPILRPLILLGDARQHAASSNGKTADRKMCRQSILFARPNCCCGVTNPKPTVKKRLNAKDRGRKQKKPTLSAH